MLLGICTCRRLNQPKSGVSIVGIQEQRRGMGGLPSSGPGLAHLHPDLSVCFAPARAVGEGCLKVPTQVVGSPGNQAAFSSNSHLSSVNSGRVKSVLLWERLGGSVWLRS